MSILTKIYRSQIVTLRLSHNTEGLWRRNKYSCNYHIVHNVKNFFKRFAISLLMNKDSRGTQYFCFSYCLQYVTNSMLVYNCVIKDIHHTHKHVCIHTHTQGTLAPQVATSTNSYFTRWTQWIIFFSQTVGKHNTAGSIFQLLFVHSF